MPPRSSSLERICAAAVVHFAERGYDGGSLNDIAEAAGIRKPSLYAHFAGKDDLYMQLLANAMKIELEHAAGCFTDSIGRIAPGIHYCRELPSRYAGSIHLRFLLRTVFLPPAHLRDEVSGYYQQYLDALLEHFQAELQADRYVASNVGREDCALYGQAYLGIVDSLHVELVHAGGRTIAARIDAFQRLLADSLERTLIMAI